MSETTIDPVFLHERCVKDGVPALIHAASHRHTMGMSLLYEARTYNAILEAADHYAALAAALREKVDDWRAEYTGAPVVQRHTLRVEAARETNPILEMQLDRQLWEDLRVPPPRKAYIPGVGVTLTLTLYARDIVATFLENGLPAALRPSAIRMTVEIETDR